MAAPWGLQERRLALRQQVIFAHKSLNFLGVYDYALASEGGCHPSIAVEDVLEANALDYVAQLALGRLAAVLGLVAIIRRARQTMVRGFFDNIDHDILLGLLKKRIDDDRFIGLIDGMLKAGYMEDWVYGRTYSGRHRAALSRRCSPTFICMSSISKCRQ